MKNGASLTILVLVCGLLSACGTAMQTEPVGVGRDVNDLKMSPCACNAVPMHFPPGALFRLPVGLPA